MFKVVEELTFWWPVKVLEPDPEQPGKLVERTFEAAFSLINEDEAKRSAEARRRIVSGMTPDLDESALKAIAEALEEHDMMTLRRVLVDWRGIVSETDVPLRFNNDTFDQIYKIKRVRQALVRAYAEAISEDKARLGN